MLVRGYYHWFSEINLPEPILDEECQALYPRLMVGDVEARNRIILGHIRLGMSIVSRFAGSFPHKTDEMVAIMCDTLVTRVERISDGSIEHHKIPNIGGYLMTRISRRLQRFLHEDHTVRIPEATFKRRKKEGRPLERPKHHEIKEEHLLVDDSKYLQIENIEEVINAITTNERERVVVTLRMEGETDQQIAEKLQCKYQNVQYLRKKIGNRFLEKFGGHKSNNQ